MSAAANTAIDLVEAGYNLELDVGDWLPNLNAVGKPLFDLGPGFYSALVGGVSDDGQHLVTQVHQGGGPPDLMVRMWEGARKAGPEVVGAWSQAAASRGVATMSDLKDELPRGYEVLSASSGCEGGMVIAGLDPDGHGVLVSILSDEPLALTPNERERWKMLGIHLAAGFRLRRRLIEAPSPSGVTATEMPLDAEALLDPTKFVVSQAAGGAQDRPASEAIREAAVRVDRARGKLRKSDPEEALELWHGLVRGRWSLVDWFDTDGRRFMLAKPNAPHLGDPRGLTEQEHQVATYAARGDSNKLISYRFGISPQRVSAVMRSAMHKLGARTPAQLVAKIGVMTQAVAASQAVAAVDDE